MCPHACGGRAFTPPGRVFCVLQRGAHQVHAFFDEFVVFGLCWLLRSLVLVLLRVSLRPVSILHQSAGTGNRSVSSGVGFVYSQPSLSFDVDPGIPPIDSILVAAHGVPQGHALGRLSPASWETRYSWQGSCRLVQWLVAWRTRYRRGTPCHGPKLRVRSLTWLPW